MERTFAMSSSLALLVCASCVPSESGEGLADASETVVISESDTAFVVRAPAGEYNAFSLSVGWSYSDPGGHTSASRDAYSIAANPDCLDCMLPANIDIGEPIEGFTPQACLAPVDPDQMCQVTTQIDDLTLSDLMFPQTTPTGDPLPYRDITMTFFRVYEMWDENAVHDESTPNPRVDTATAMVSLRADGTIDAVSDWAFRVDALNTPF